MKPLHKLGKYRNLDKLKKIATDISLDIDFIPRVREAIKVVNYFVYDFCNQ